MDLSEKIKKHMEAEEPTVGILLGRVRSSCVGGGVDETTVDNIRSILRLSKAIDLDENKGKIRAYLNITADSSNIDQKSLQRARQLVAETEQKEAA